MNPIIKNACINGILNETPLHFLQVVSLLTFREMVQAVNGPMLAV